MSNIVLPDTSLCAIVRDEIMNPAGGIERFIDAHVPHVEEAVIVDTGSIDGTRQILAELTHKYPNMMVLDYKFDNYSNARNFSLTNAHAKYALVLDADELLTEEKPTNDWRILFEIISNGQRADTYYFEFKHVSPESDSDYSATHHDRLFLREKHFFAVSECGYEDFSSKGIMTNSTNSGVKIKHFQAFSKKLLNLLENFN